ncbi:MAG: thrombospondin type 3 repeat-containing protein, partial [Polyangiaceae bacterium]
DQDGDGVGDLCDNCRTAANAYAQCSDHSDCVAGAKCIPVDNATGHCSKQGDDEDEDGLGDACDSCPAVANANLTQNSNSFAERRELETEHLPDACDPVPLLGMRPILEQGPLSKIQPDSEQPNPGNTVYFRASAQLGDGGYAATRQADVGFRRCDCVVPGFGPAPLEDCVGAQKQCSWAPEEYNSASSKWVPISIAQSNRSNALGDLAAPLPRNSKVTRTFSSARWLEDRFQYANTNEREAQRLGEPELLAWRFGLDLERTGDPNARVPSYQVDGLEQTWGAVWSYTRGDTFASARDEKRRQRLRDSYTYVHTPSFEVSIPYADPTPLNDCGLPNCSPWLDPWYLWPIDPDPFVNPVLLGQLAQPALALPRGNTSVLLRPDGEALDVGDQLAASGVGELLSQQQVAFINPVEDGATLRRLGDPLQFAAIPSPWEPNAGAVVEVKASSSGLFPAIAEGGLQQPELPPPATVPMPGAPALAPEESAPPPITTVAAPGRREGAVSVLSASERSVFLVGGGVDREETLGEVWRYALDNGTWHRLEFNGARVDGVLAATFDWEQGRLLVLDETGNGWFKRGRLLELDLKTKQARVVASWPRLGVYERLYLMQRADGELWAFGSTRLGSTHVFRGILTNRGLRVRGFAQLRGRLKRAPHNAPNGAYVALERRGVPSIEHIDSASFKETTQCWSGL